MITIERFWSRIQVTPGCWEWMGYRQPNGYGQQSKLGPGLERMAHRAAYALTFGPIPAGSFLCHRCDNPPCCNPDHLFVGSHTDNMRDMAAKGRRVTRLGRAGRRTGMNEGKVRSIRAMAGSGLSRADIGHLHGVSGSTARSIIERRIWRHIP